MIAESPARPNTQDLSLEKRAVIAAAVYVALGSDARISSIAAAQHVATPRVEPQMFAWSLAGRSQIQGGHNVR